MAFAFSLTLGPTLALADGGSSGTNADCPRGEVWDSRSQKCVKQQGSVLPDKVLTDYAYALAKAERYDEALATLDLLRNPDTAEALKYQNRFATVLGTLAQNFEPDDPLHHSLSDAVTTRTARLGLPI